MKLIKKILEMVKKLNIKEAILIVAITLLWNNVVYFGSRLITTSWHHYDITIFMDEWFPLIEWTVVIYFGCYVFWIANFFLALTQNREDRDRFFAAELFAKTICLVFFVLLPTTNVRPEIVGDSLWDHLMRLLYWVDAPDNLFPSIHCMVSWFCWIAVRKRKEIPLWYKNLSLLSALVVCVVTLTTKQHVIVDTFSGVLLAEVCYYVAGHTKLTAYYSAFIDRLKVALKI